MEHKGAIGVLQLSLTPKLGRKGVIPVLFAKIF